MKTALPLFLFLLLGCLRLNAENTAPGFYNNCLECGTPQNLAVQNVTANSATLLWNTVAGATKYNIEVENTQNSSGFFHLDTTVTGISFQLGGLQAGKTYKFKVRARCGGDHGDWADWFFFTTGSGTTAPGDSTSNPVDTSANCAAPTMLASVVTGTTALLSWNHVGNAGQYYLEVEDEQNQPSNFHLEVPVSDTFYQLNGILPNVLYKFKVSTHCDSSSHGPWSGWQFFNGNTDSTSTGGNGGGGSGCGKPVGLHVTGIGSTEVDLHWFAVPGALTYTLEIERYQNNPSNPWQITQVAGTNSFHLTGLNANTRYKFKVRANCASGHGDWSNWRKFKTANGFLAPTQFNHGSALTEREDSPSEGAPAFDLQIWPNPVKTTATIRLGHLKSDVTRLRVMDLSGRTVQDLQFRQDGNELEETVSFRELPEGCYLLQVQNGAEVKSTKLVVIR